MNSLLLFRPANLGARDTPPDSSIKSSLVLGQMIGAKVENMTRREGGPATTSTEIPVKIGRNTKWISGVNEQTKCGVRVCLHTSHLIFHVSCLHVRTSSGVCWVFRA